MGKGRKARKLLQSLPEKTRTKLVNALKEASFDDLAGVKGVGSINLAEVLGVDPFIYQRPWPDSWPPPMDWLREQWVLAGEPWPQFRLHEGSIVFREPDQYVHALHHTFSYRVILNLMQHFDLLGDIRDVNEALTDLRDIKTHLEVLVRLNNPVVVDYLRTLKAVLEPV